MVKKNEIPDRLIDTAMRLAAERGWSGLSLAEIAAEAELPLSQVYPLFDSKQAILSAFSRRLDAAVLAEELSAEELAEPARDRLFEVMMRRFDALQPYREALANILYDSLRRPLQGLAGTPQLARSMRWMLEAAGLNGEGVRGAVRVKGLSAIYLATLRVWLRDDSADLAKTMASLDAQLRRVEGLLNRSRSLRRPGARQETPPPESAAEGAG
ncbi:MAG: TetR/AcrR family transcriptional regulator [Rhodovibrionaceae bacterium]